MIPERKSIMTVTFFIGIACICLSYVIAFSGIALAQSEHDYVGVEECSDCHLSISKHFEESTHAMTFVSTLDNLEAIIGDFSIGEDTRLYTFSNDPTPRPFTVEDIVFVVGAGKVAQRYVIDAGEGDYRVLPVEWNVESNDWQTFSLPDGDSWSNCSTCHTTGYDANSHQWVDNSVTCEACHGAGLQHVEAADDAGGRVDAEELLEIQSAIITMPEPSTCATCHTQLTAGASCEDAIHCTMGAYDAWEISPHAQQDDENEYLLACSGCHSVHNDDNTFPNLLIESPENTCVACHDTNAESLISGAVIVDNIEGKPSAHYDEGVTCESCHNVHSVLSIPEDQTLDTTCTNCHTDLTQNSIRDFADGAQEKVTARLEQIDSILGSDAPEWVQTVVDVIHNDGSGGIHNFAYVSRLLNAVELELGIRTAQLVTNMPSITASDPTECAECHSDVHDMWQESPHANASLSQTFQQAYAENGQQSYCMSCHASGYDATTQTYVFEGVVCSTCHTVEGSEHPPSPVSVDNSSESCGRCHSGEHSPEYNEWLVSDHSTFNIDCVDCHVAHDNSLRLGSVNETCADCHTDAMNDEVHMGDDMDCVDCHMTRTDKSGEVIHHTMFFDPKTCAECHGDIHTLQIDITRDLNNSEQEMFSVMEEEISTLETKADTNLQSGIVGGAVGALVLVGFLLLVIRIGRIR